MSKGYLVFHHLEDAIALGFEVFSHELNGDILVRAPFKGSDGSLRWALAVVVQTS